MNIIRQSKQSIFRKIYSLTYSFFQPEAKGRPLSKSSATVSWHLCPSSGKLSESDPNVLHRLILCGFSLIGAASRRLTLIKVFLIVLILHLLASIGTGIYAIRITFLEEAQYKINCVSDSVDPAIIQGCDHAIVLLKAFVIGVYILAWLLQTCKLF